MSTNRAWVWAGRVAALIAAVIIPACGNNGASSGAQPGIFWNSQSSTGAGIGTPTAGWVDPNLGVVGPIGIQNIITSVDDATYDGYFPQGTGLGSVVGGNQNPTKVTYIFGVFHPLSTDTGSLAITSRESTLQGYINAYRQTKLGGAGAGGGVGGGIAVGNTTGIILAGYYKGNKMARAHCKHYAKFHGAFPAQNFEGDLTFTTVANTPAFTPGTPPLEPLVTPPVAEQGRLGKIDVLVTSGESILYSGGNYSEPDVVLRQLTRDYPTDVLLLWTHFSVGHWRGGPDVYYWNILFLEDPDPIQ